MHIAIFIDQPVSSLGGVQTSVVLQKKYLEKLGHIVTICQPASRKNQVSTSEINIPSFSIGSEYRAYIPTKRRLRWLAESLKSFPPVDIVHVQADYWGAISGLYFAKAQQLPVVMTCHTNVEIGMRQVVGTLGMKILTLYFSYLTNRLLGGPHLGSWTDPWALTRHLAQWAQLVLAPSRHFAKHLENLALPST
ncbi:glycosyltransferase [bacterium]|nr:MAG: glycosyltransferase [bacterium]